jgi:hypothetical protein
MATTDARAEAQTLLALHGGPERLAACLEVVSRQFATIQSRTQLLLTLATITLTITGFSGPKIAESGVFARLSLSIGLGFVLAAVLILLSTLRIRWLTQFSGPDALGTLTDILEYRNRKTSWYLFELALLAVGLGLYVAAVIAYLSSGITLPVPR